MADFLAKFFGMFENIFSNTWHFDATAVFAELKKFFEGLKPAE